MNAEIATAVETTDNTSSVEPLAKSMKDIPLKDLKAPEDVDKAIKEHIGIGFAECAQALSNSLAERAEELLEDIVNVAPYGNYEKVMEDQGEILAFLKEESVKTENWGINFIEVKSAQLMELVFTNKSVDDGDILKGFVFVGLSGKIRHAFCQVHV